MYTIAIWNKRSTNYNANAFVKANGTETFRLETAAKTLLQMGCLMDDPQIEQIVLDCPTWWRGALTWVQPHKAESCPYEYYGCDNCPDRYCDGCLYDEDDEYNMNDPRHRFND